MHISKNDFCDDIDFSLDSHLSKLFVETYQLMYVYLMGDSRKNELYIAKYIDFFQSQFELREVCFTMCGFFQRIQKLLQNKYSQKMVLKLRITRKIYRDQLQCNILILID